MNDSVDPEDAGVSLPGGVPLEAKPPSPPPPDDPRDAGKSQQKEPIPIVLTFDDGPHGDPAAGSFRDLATRCSSLKFKPSSLQD